jgi:protein-disulfide isomerase
MTEHHEEVHKKSFFESFSSKTSFFAGLIAGILVISTIGFFVLLGVTLSKSNGGDDKTGNKVAQNNNQAAQPANPSATADPKVTDVSKVTKNDHIRGNLNSPVVMIEYSDFQCPYCQMLDPTLKKLVEDYKGKVVWVYRHFPLESLHPFAKKSAEASECADEQGKFWEYADKLYENQTSFSDTYFSQLAGTLGLDQTKFDNCLSSNKYASKVDANASEAAKAGITGTPGVFVNDQFVRGAMPYENFKQIIDGILNK